MTNNKTRSLALALLITFLLALSGCGGGSSSPSNLTSEQSQPAPTDQTQTSPVPLSEATVTKIVDGDTIHARLSSGAEEKIRFIGVDTPETKHPSKPVQPYGPEADAYTRGQLNDKQIWLELDVQERDQYGRLLAYYNGPRKLDVTATP